MVKLRILEKEPKLVSRREPATLGGPESRPAGGMPGKQRGRRHGSEGQGPLPALGPPVRGQTTHTESKLRCHSWPEDSGKEPSPERGPFCLCSGKEGGQQLLVHPREGSLPAPRNPPKPSHRSPVGRVPAHHWLLPE